ncbi:MAG: site-2 protease family protein [Candidatus Obscuribacter sp.]|nr:site-2 protease family protein [Candidatus Melainabacteria bacterium]MDX1985650.1 site-2 protease family protein [Candidatus Obscuribacter sp.]
MNSTFLISIAALASLIFFHELGHWLVARALGFKTTTFSIGFGPSAKLFRFWQTDFRLGVIPLGGYVNIPELSDEESGKLALQEQGLEADTYMQHAGWKKALVMLAGPGANICFAYLIYVVLLMVHRQLAPLDALAAAVATTANATASVLHGLAMLLHLSPLDTNLPAGATDLHSVVAIFQVINSAAGSSAILLGQYLAYLSLNLAIFNLLPMPLLDGGQLLFLFLETLSGKPLSAQWRANLALVSLIAILILTTIGLTNDFLKPISMG